MPTDNFRQTTESTSYKGKARIRRKIGFGETFCFRISVHGEQATTWTEPVQNRQRMAAAPKGAIHINTPSLYV
jgi:hypothetical protein